MLFRLVKISLILLFMVVQPIYSQEFGGFKPSKKWMQLNTEKYRIIYSPENEKQARNTAAIIDQQYQLRNNIGVKREKLNIVLQNSTTNANGYVGLAPFVSEFFLTPFSNSFALGSLPWTYTLGIHEYQHVLQYNNSKTGISKLGYYFGGEQVLSFLSFLSTPNWFFEGDAVRAETQYSNQGRGRLPYFHNAFRTYAQNNNYPKYDKLRNGSFRDFLPNHYRFGYIMAAHGKEKYGNQFWPTVLKQSARYRGIFYPMSQALKRNSGNNSTKFYKESVKEFGKKWENTKNEIGRPIYTPKKNEVVNFQFPQIDVDSSLYYYASSYDEIGKIYQLKGKESKAVYTTGIRNSNYFDVFNGQLLTTQTYFDKRWKWIDYSDIIIYDSKTQKLKKLTEKGKYFQPSYSPNCDKIVSYYVSQGHKFHLEIITIQDTSKKIKISNKENYYYNYPVWKNENTIVCGTRDSLGQMSLTEVNIATGEHTHLFTSFHVIGKPSIKNGKIYFAASFSGIDNLYEFDGKNLNQLSKNGSGRYQAEVSPFENKIYFTNFTLNGQVLKEAELTAIETAIEVTPLKELKQYQNQFFEDAPVVSTTASNDTLIVKKYSKFNRLINIHSWGFEADNPIFGASINSRNILNTLNLSAGYKYNINENTGGIDANLNYAQYFLHLNAGVSSIQRSIKQLDEADLDYDENQISAGLSLPLNYSSNTFRRNLYFSADYQFSNLNFKAVDISDLTLHSTKLRATYRQVKLAARKNIFTPFGIYSNLIEQKGLNENVFQLLWQNSLALKGLAKNHSFILDADGQYDKGNGVFLFSNLFNYARGYESFRFRELYRLGANYHFPIAYPDQGTLGIIYLLRIRGNLFYDYSVAASESREFNSTGAELIFDLKMMRAVPVTVGFRYSQILSQQAYSENQSNGYFEIFIPVNRF